MAISRRLWPRANDSRKRHPGVRQAPVHVQGGFAGAARALRRRPRSRLAGSVPCAGCARRRGFESGAGREPTRYAGMNLCLCPYRFKQPLTAVYRATLPFYLILLAGVLLITYVPELATLPVKWLGL